MKRIFRIIGGLLSIENIQFRMRFSVFDIALATISAPGNFNDFIVSRARGRMGNMIYGALLFRDIIIILRATRKANACKHKTNNLGMENAQQLICEKEMRTNNKEIKN